MAVMSRKRTPTHDDTEIQLTVRGGDVPPASRDYAVKKIGHVASYSSQPVLYAHVVMELVGDPARERPALAEATLDVNGTPVRAHVAAGSPEEAVDMLETRLRRQLVQLEDRLRTRHRGGTTGEHEWRHGDLPSARPEYAALSPEERTVIKHKTFALQEATADEAVSDMELLGHDFYLFTEVSSGDDAVIYRLPGGGYGLHAAHGAQLQTGKVPLEAHPGPAPTMTEQDAVGRLDLGGDPFVFHLDPDTGRGRVLYRRFDGHYGLITVA